MTAREPSALARQIDAALVGHMTDRAHPTNRIGAARAALRTLGGGR